MGKCCDRNWITYQDYINCGPRVCYPNCECREKKEEKPLCIEILELILTRELKKCGLSVKT